MMRLITPRRLKENEDFMRRMAARYLDVFVERGRCEFVEDYAHPLSLLVVAYLPLWKNELIDYDDELHITQNSHVKGGLSWPGVVWAWKNDQAPYWMPLTWLR